MGLIFRVSSRTYRKTKLTACKKNLKKWIKPTNLDTPKSSPSSAEPVPKVNVPKSESNSLTTNEPSPEMSKGLSDKVISLLFWNLNGKLDEFDRFRIFWIDRQFIGRFFDRNLLKISYEN